MPFTDMSPREDKVCSQLLSRLYFRTEDGFPSGSRAAAGRYMGNTGISGDLPVIYISLDEKDDGRAAFRKPRKKRKIPFELL